MPDMLVKLYEVKQETELFQRLERNGIQIKRALAPDRRKVLAYIEKNFNQNWADECRAAFSNQPITCYIAVKDKAVIGFACYDATAKNFFGPTGVTEQERGCGVGTALLNRCLLSMQEDGYGYAIIGWVNSALKFYQKTVNAQVIEGSFPGVYGRMIEID